MLTQLKNLNLERMDLEEALALYAFGESLQAKYDSFQIDTPEWLTENLAALKREVQDRVRDELVRKIRMDESALETLKTQAEKRAETKRRLDGARAKLASLG